MFKRWFAIPASMLLVLTLMATTASLFAADDRPTPSGISKLASKVAVILGIDATAVDEAIKQAKSELMQEALQKKLSAMVENGLITEEQAQQKFEGLHELRAGKQFQRGLSKGRFGKKAFQRGPMHDLDNLQIKIDALVENGSLTQEQANEKVDWIQAKSKNHEKAGNWYFWKAKRTANLERQK